MIQPFITGNKVEGSVEMPEKQNMRFLSNFSAVYSLVFRVRARYTG